MFFICENHEITSRPEKRLHIFIDMSIEHATP